MTLTAMEIFELEPVAFQNEIRNADEVTTEKLLLFAYSLIHYKLID